MVLVHKITLSWATWNLHSLLKSRSEQLRVLWKFCYVIRGPSFFHLLYYPRYAFTIDAFKLWCWRRLLRVLCTAKRSNQLTLKEINPEYSLEGLMLKLKLQYLGHLMQRTDSLEKILMLGKIEGRRRRGWQSIWDGWITSLVRWTWVWVRPQELAMDRETWCVTVHGVMKNRTWLSNWTEESKMCLTAWILAPKNLCRHCMSHWLSFFPMLPH